MLKWRLVAVAWFATLLLAIGLGFYYISEGQTPPTELSVMAILLTISGSGIMLAVAREEDK